MCVTAYVNNVIKHIYYKILYNNISHNYVYTLYILGDNINSNK